MGFSSSVRLWTVLFTHLNNIKNQPIFYGCFSVCFTVIPDRKHRMCCKEYEPKLPNPKIQIKRCNILPATANCVAAVT